MEALEKNNNDDQSSASAPLDAAKVSIRVDWAEQLPPGWGASLKNALQKWCNLILSDLLDVNCGVVGFRLTGDGTTAEVEIIPPSVLSTLKKMKIATLVFKNLKQSAIVHFLLSGKSKDEPQSPESTADAKMGVSKVSMVVTAVMDLEKLPLTTQTELLKRFWKYQVDNYLSVTGSFDTINKFYKSVCGIVQACSPGRRSFENETTRSPPGNIVNYRTEPDQRINMISRLQSKVKASVIDARKSKTDEEDNCPICLDSFTDETKLKCGHGFCKECLEHSVKIMGKICPLCKKVFGILIGNQPHGTMNVSHYNYTKLPGYPKCGVIEINYNIPDGTQTHEHPNPGRPYHGTSCMAYLPDNPEGNHVLGLLRRAFDQRLIFTVGTSRTSGMDDAVIWNDVHHKTNTHGGSQNFGYPDPEYLKRVKEELKAKGIE